MPVEVGVAGRLVCLANLGEDGRDSRAPGQPLHERGGAAGREDLVDRLGVGMQAALVMGQQGEEVLAAGAAGAQPMVVKMFGGPAFRARPERGRVLAVTRAAQRPGREPGGDGTGVAAGYAGFASPAAGPHSGWPSAARVHTARLWPHRAPAA